MGDRSRGTGSARRPAGGYDTMPSVKAEAFSGGVAQTAEQATINRLVVGSKPTAPTNAATVAQQ